MIGWPLLSAAEGAVRRTFEFGRIRTNSDWILPIVACLAILIFVRAIYRRDAGQKSRPFRLALTALRGLAFLMLLFFYLQPQWRSEREVLRSSKALVLVDTSSSMGLADGKADTAAAAATRLHHVGAALDDSGFLASLRGTHDAVVHRFDAELEQLASLPKSAGSGSSGQSLDGAPRSGKWTQRLRPTGRETRLGQALVELIRQREAEPVAGIVVFSDGGQNAGVLPQAAVEMARQARLPIYTIGLGATEQPVNVRVYRLEAVSRAFPGDPLTVTGLIQTQGGGDPLAGRSITVELLQRPGGRDAPGAPPGTGALVGSERVILGRDGDSVPVKFEVIPGETGLRTLCLRIRPPADDRNSDDDFLETEVEVVDRKDRVLLFAGGPTRDYQFLRAQLFRDASMSVDICLQTAQPGISQEADKILDEFPATREEMFAYDSVVAFDPNWQALSPAQVELVESWVAEQGGGLIAVAGPVYTGEPVGGWVHDQALGKIRSLYPVEFPRQLAVWDAETQTAEEPWPLDFTREGLEAEFLWLADTAAANAQSWASFPGVYSHQPVRGPKPAATVYARVSDPRTGQAGERPVFLAGQFYGSGRVLYLGSGELWRLRAVDPGYFERLTTRMIRHVSQGRMLRQSSRGMLLVAQERLSVGSTLSIRGQLTDARFAPLDLPEVELEVYPPDGSVETITMQPDTARPGAYLGQLTVLQEGVYRLELPVPDSRERITRRIRVDVPDLEGRSPQRNEHLLRLLAEETGGKYYADIDAAVDSDNPAAIVHQLKDRTRTLVLTAAPDRLWAGGRLWWFLIGLCGLLCVEWLIRRIARLA